VDGSLHKPTYLGHPCMPGWVAHEQSTIPLNLYNLPLPPSTLSTFQQAPDYIMQIPVSDLIPRWHHFYKF